MDNKLMFSSASEMWDTPDGVVEDLATVFDWDLDVCASKPNVCATYYDGSDGRDGLIEPWGQLNWCNPPYGRVYPKWMRRGYQEFAMYDHTSVFLVPSRTDTRAWQDFAPCASHVTLIAGRLTFGTRESWIERHCLTIWKSNNTKPIRAAVKKIGGALCPEAVQVKVAGMWGMMKRPFTFDEWLEMDYLKYDNAPFPSAFVVFGELTGEQSAKLASYGWTP